MIFYDNVGATAQEDDDKVFNHDIHVLADVPVTKDGIVSRDYPDSSDINFLFTKHDENFGKELKELLNEEMLKKTLIQMVINYINGRDRVVLDTLLSKELENRLKDMGFSVRIENSFARPKFVHAVLWPTKDAITTVKHYYQLWGESNAFIQKACNMILLNLKSEFKEYEKFLDRGFIQASTFLSNRSENSEDEVVAAQIKRYLKTYDFKCDVSFETKHFVNVTCYF